MRKKVGCPKKGCNYYVSARSAEDALAEMKEHYKDDHGMQDLPDFVKEQIEGTIKTESKKRV